MRLLYWIVAFGVAAAATAFAVSNSGRVRLDFWPLAATIEWPVYVVVFASALVGLAVGAAAASISTVKARWAARGAARALEAAERALAQRREPTEPADPSRPRLPIAADPT